jgi:hypothetical protein
MERFCAYSAFVALPCFLPLSEFEPAMVITPDQGGKGASR